MLQTLKNETSNYVPDLDELGYAIHIQGTQKPQRWPQTSLYSCTQTPLPPRPLRASLDKRKTALSRAAVQLFSVLKHVWV